MPSLAGLFFWMNRKIENINKITITKPLKLDCGKTIKNFPLAYETYGKLNENKDNAILVFHALTGDQFVTGTNPVTCLLYTSPSPRDTRRSRMPSSA